MLLKNWQRRWIVLFSDRIVWKKGPPSPDASGEDESESEVKGEIPFDSKTVVQESDPVVRCGV